VKTSRLHKRNDRAFKLLKFFQIGV